MLPLPLQKMRINDVPSDFEEEVHFQVSSSDMSVFADLSGDRNPLHMDDEYAQVNGYRGRVVYGALLMARISEFIGMRMPGCNVLWLYNKIDFLKPVYIGDDVRMKVFVKHVSEAANVAEFGMVMSVKDEAVARGGFGVKVLS